MSSPLEPFKVDYTSFYKFVTSVGLILVASAAAIPWFVMRAAIPDVVPKSDAAKTLELAVDTRARQYLLALQAYPWVSLGLILMGLLLTIYGLVAWKSRQAKQDADEDESYRQRRELGRTTAATPAEREEKLEDETESAETPPEPSIPTAPTPPDPSSSNSPAPGSLPEPHDNRGLLAARDRTARRERLEGAERRVGQLLGSSFLETHTVEMGVRVAYPEAPSPTSILDFVARAKQPDRWTSFAVEVQVSTARGLAIIPDTLRRSMLRVAIAARGVPQGPVPNGTRGRPALAKSVSVLIVILSTSLENEFPSSMRSRPIGNIYKQVKTRVLELNSVLSRMVGVVVLDEEKLYTLEAEEFSQLLVTVLRYPDIAHVDDKFDRAG